MANNVVFKTELLKGATGDRGEAGVAESVPTDGVILTTSETVPQGYEEIDVGDIFTELEAEIEERAKEDIVTDAYDATHTYNSGDYAIYNDTLYKCNTDNTTGAFNGNYWDAVTVMGEIADAQDDITTLNSTLTYLQQQTDVTSAFIVGSVGGYSKVYRTNKNISGIIILTGVTIGDYKQLDSSLIPKADRAVFSCYNFATGAPITNLTAWILSTGILTFYGTAPASTTQVAIPINYMTV